MRGASSSPTNRALDILELLAAKPANQLRYIDIVKILELNQGTAHTILKTLVDRGWVSRDPVDKTFMLGPALAAIASRADQDRPRVIAARGIAEKLAEELGFASSVVELVNNELLIPAFFAGETALSTPRPGLKVPYIPPYGTAFAAFSSAEERSRWLERSGTQSQEVNDALERVLALANERGYDVDLTTPAVAQLTTLVGSHDDIHPSMLTAMEHILLELSTLAFDDSDADRHVTSITAPILGAAGHTNLGIAIHPMRSIPLRRIRACGNRLAEEAAKLSLI